MPSTRSKASAEVAEQVESALAEDKVEKKVAEEGSAEEEEKVAEAESKEETEVKTDSAEATTKESGEADATTDDKENSKDSEAGGDDDSKESTEVTSEVAAVKRPAEEVDGAEDKASPEKKAKLEEEKPAAEADAPQVAVEN